MSIVGLIILVSSLLGYNNILRILDINAYLSWITSMLVQTILLYIFAMLGYLHLGIYIVTLMGVVFFISTLLLVFFKKRKLKHTKKIYWFDIWMLIFGLLLINVLHNSPLVHYDNYSHWATIIKFLVFEGHLPDAAQKLITFTSYPPATALFITNFVFWVHFSESAMLIGQFVLIWAALYAMFGVLRDRMRSLNTFVICFVISLIQIFNISIRMNNLLVDFLLPLIAVAGLIGIYIYKNQVVHQITHTVIFVTALFLIKNSGSFYVIILIGFLFYQLLINSKSTNKFFSVIHSFSLSSISFIAGFLPLYWWNKHVHYVFGGLSKHQVNLEAYQKQLGNETQNIISDIAQKFISQIFGGNSLSTKGLVLVNIILLVAWGIIRFGLKKKVAIVKVAMLLNTITFFYYLSLFIMYIVSMPYSEAIQIAGFERYMSSIIVFDLLISAITLSIIIDKTFYEQSIEKRDFHAFHSIMSKNIYQVSSLLLLLFSIIFMFSEINGTKYSNRMSVNTLPDQLKRIAKEEYTFNQKKILIVDPHKENISDQYTSVVGRYYFFNDTVIGRENFMMSSSDFYRTIQGYDYVVIPEWHRTFTVMVAKVYHQSIKTGMYKIEKSGLVKTNMIILK